MLTLTGQTTLSDDSSDLSDDDVTAEEKEKKYLQRFASHISSAEYADAESIGPGKG